ncbi:hypothetical protein FGB62_21g213 [Gracilaria domingensis]|nr:hypothetical protein FGB62_21g213 [Gracilaria domingensis]
MKRRIHMRKPAKSAEGPTLGCGEPKTERIGQASFVTTQTRGFIFIADDLASLADVVVSVISGLKHEIDSEIFGCQDKVAVNFDPNLPVAITPGCTCEVRLLLSGVGFTQLIKPTSISCTNSFELE